MSVFSIGQVAIRNRVFLAPMSGITDVPFRRLAWKFGAGLVVSEMVASDALVTGKREMLLKAENSGLPVHVVQLSGRQEKWIAEGARMAEAAGANIIDINMGCPSKRVTTGYAGSALMRDLDHAMRLIDATLAAVSVPVTLKMRLGWDHSSINAPELAKRAVEAGVKMITVHGRTRCQFYKGKADWSAVRAVKDAIDVPLVVNGDIGTCEQAKEAMTASGADAVMVGRAAYGAPWLPGQIASEIEGTKITKEPEGSQFLEIVKEHYEAILSFYGTTQGVRQARKHIGWYFDRLQSSPEMAALRRVALTETSPEIVLATIDQAIGNIPLLRAA